MIFSFLIKKSKLKAIEIEIAFFFLPLGNPKGRTLDYFFYASYIRHNVPYKLIPISMSCLGLHIVVMIAGILILQEIFAIDMLTALKLL